MSLPRIATREEWLAARKELLAKEKNLTRQRDALSTERRNLPMVEIVKDYQFDGPDGVTIDASRGFDEYNYRSLDEYAAAGQESMKTADQPYDMPGLSCFLQADGRVFHTYSQYARGLESTGGSYYFLDLTALGRQEEWEEPAGRSKSARSATPDFAS